ncbi:MAG: aldose 1-epimerase family protein [Oscillospiraceae bacterium]|jgi:galactose mutarotase-like enzyme|nr:aldose 1-epimerase family protein [Oscillospiraceae bacterium]
MTVNLKSAKASADIDSKGAQLLSFVGEDNTEYLWQGKAPYWQGRSPILFPIVGRLREDKAIIGGKEYNMGRHGFARHREFEVEQPDDSTAVFTLKSDEESKKQYPFDFIFKMVYTLNEDTLTWKYVVENTGKTDMPYAVGGHPAFNCPLEEGEVYEDYAIEFKNEEKSKCPKIDLHTGLIDFGSRYDALKGSNKIDLSQSLFANDALVFDDLKSRSCKLFSKKSGKGVEMVWEGFDLFGIWSSTDNAPFVCLEPWTGCATAVDENDTFETKRNLIFLKLGETRSKSFSVRIL